MATGDSPTQQAILISLSYLRVALWALAGVILLAAGAVVDYIPQITCSPGGTSSYCSTSSGGFEGGGLVVLGLALLIYAGYRGNQVYKAEKKQAWGPPAIAAPAASSYPPSVAQPTVPRANAPGNCTNCGAPLVQGARFCPGCGRSVG